ncbi:MAG: protein-disulfide reductase DsbD [Thiotrichales bacterium]
MKTPKQTSLRTWLALTLTLLVAPLLAADPDELLMPDDAFAFSARESEPGVVAAQWKIAPGYYLYRDKFKFEPAAPVELGSPDFPTGEVKQDEFFGAVETYRDTLVIKVPARKLPADGGAFDLKVSYQGCADVGVCYPPQHQTVSLKLAAAAVTAPEQQARGVLTDLKRDLGGQPELLPPDEAFAFRSDLAAPDRLIAEWDIADDYYLYKNKIKLQLEDATGLSLGKPSFPVAERIDDPTFGSVEIFRGPLRLEYPILGLTGAPAALGLSAQFQGCADVGVCYPPMQKAVKFEPSRLALLKTSTTAAAPTDAGATPPAASGAEPQSEQDMIAGSLASGNTTLTLLTFFGFGLLLAFTPCVFPMIPILSGIIVGHGHKISTRNAFALSLAYVLAMALTYTVLGVLAGLFGANIQAWFQNPWVLGVFAAIFVLLSLSMFGFYELQMPSSIQTRLTLLSNKQQGGKLTSAAIMGFLSAIIVGPCVTAPLIGALIYIGQTGDAVLGGAALFALSLGMGAPLLLIGASAGKLLPRAGAWMDVVKAVFGVLLLGVAIWLIERVVPAVVTMLLWAVLLIVSGVYMGAMRHTPPDRSSWHHLWKGLGYVLVLYGSLLVIGAAGGGKDVLQPLKGVFTSTTAGGAAVAADKLEFLPVKGPDGVANAIKSANAAGRPVMLDFYADWCISCKEMERFTFSDPGVRQTLGRAVLIKADVTPNDEADRALLKQYGLFGPPAILFFDTQGEERKNFRVVGFVPADKFKAHAAQALQ